MVLKGAFGAQLLESRSDGSFNCEKSLEGKNIHYRSTHQSNNNKPVWVCSYKYLSIARFTDKITNVFFNKLSLFKVLKKFFKLF